MPTSSRQQSASGSPEQMTFTFSAPVMIPQGDGSFVIRPGKPKSEFTPLEFSKAYGVHRNTVYYMIDMGIIEQHRRPMPRKILIPSDELERLRALSMDAEAMEKYVTQKKKLSFI